MSRVLRDKSDRYDLLLDSNLGSLILAFSVRLYSGALAGSGAKCKAEQKAREIGGGSVAEWLKNWTCNSEAPSSSPTLIAGWISSR